VSVDKSSLWPPNNKMVDVHLSYSASDAPCSGVQCVVTVSSNELGVGQYEVVDPTLVRLQVQRSGTGGGRIYTITVTCTDAGGASTQKTVTVTVPHSEGQ